MLWIQFKCSQIVIADKDPGTFNQSSQFSQHVITGPRYPCPQCEERYQRSSEVELRRIKPLVKGDRMGPDEIFEEEVVELLLQRQSRLRPLQDILLRRILLLAISSR